MDNKEGQFNVLNSITPDMKSINSGYFVMTMMPSLRCKFNCPHCYLSKDERENSPVMSHSCIEGIARKVRDFYDSMSPQLPKKAIICYWYGGEPTSLGKEYLVGCFEAINRVFADDPTYVVHHDVISSLIQVDLEWVSIFNKYCSGSVQTSFDGFMRGKGYIRRWERSVKDVISSGCDVTTLSVVNKELIKLGGRETFRYLSELNIKHAGFLPFMLNVQNDSTQKYTEYAPSMREYSEFMKEITEEWIESGYKTPHIGQVSQIISRYGMPREGNVAGQTLFFMPNGDVCLPDYKNGYMEYNKVFGNIFSQTLSEILHSPERREYMRKQYLVDGNKECIGCPYKSCCVMEFWKKNKEGDDCFGASGYVEWLLGQKQCGRLRSGQEFSVLR